MRSQRQVFLYGDKGGQVQEKRRVCSLTDSTPSTFVRCLTAHDNLPKVGEVGYGGCDFAITSRALRDKFCVREILQLPPLHDHHHLLIHPHSTRLQTCSASSAPSTLQASSIRIFCLAGHSAREASLHPLHRIFSPITFYLTTSPLHSVLREPKYLETLGNG